LSGLVVTDQSGFFSVEAEGGKLYTCRLRGRLKAAAQSSDIAAVGDRVRISVQEDGSGVIEEVQPRTNVLSRAMRTEGSRGAGQAEREQVIIANADQAIFVFAAAQPTPNLKLLDRFLVMGEKTGIKNLVIVVNKIDLEDISDINSDFVPYEKMGYRVLYTQPGLGRAVKAVSQAREEGVHTTRDSALIKLASGGYLADTPGIRSLTLWDVEPEELDAYFADIAPYVSACRFGDCTHYNEPGCAVRSAVEVGTISPQRYQSYLRLRDELEAAYAVY
jgi:ribosome biogenesis GTPase